MLRCGGKLNIFFRAPAGSSYQQGQGKPGHLLATQQIILRFQKRLSMDIGAVIESILGKRVRC